MKSITKKQFKEMYNNKELKLIYSFSKTTKDIAKNKILKVISDNGIDEFKDNLINTSRADIDNQGDIFKIICFVDDNIVYVESVVDNSINKYVSWNDIEINTIAYYKI